MTRDIKERAFRYTAPIIRNKSSSKVKKLARHGISNEVDSSDFIFDISQPFGILPCNTTRPEYFCRNFKPYSELQQ